MNKKANKRRKIFHIFRLCGKMITVWTAAETVTIMVIMII